MATTTASPAANAAFTFDTKTAWQLCACVGSKDKVPPPYWDKVWIPDEKDDKKGYALVFQAYIYVGILFEVVKVPLPVYGLAIQGTQNAWDAVKDFQVTPQVFFQPVAGSAISKGSHDVLTYLLNQKGTDPNQSKLTLHQYLQTLTPGVSLLVTGHSLGGNAASVMLPWIAAFIHAFGPNQVPVVQLPASLTGITFAAPTAGDRVFAEFLNGQPNRYSAYFNTNDVVPHVWDLEGEMRLEKIYKMFDSPGPNPAPKDVKDLLDAKIIQMKAAHVSYKQTNGTTFTCPTVEPPSGAKDPWMWELGYQHNYAYCQQYLGAQGNCKPPAS